MNARRAAALRTSRKGFLTAWQSAYGRIFQQDVPAWPEDCYFLLCFDSYHQMLYGVLFSSSLITHFPLVKSGKGKGAPARETDCSDKTVTAIHVAAS